MDQKISKAAYSGDINTLHQLLQENPFILTDYTHLNPKQNPLTIAIKANQQLFLRELLRLKAELASELDEDGLRPLDVASAYGKLEIVGEIMAAVGPENICRLAGREGRMAIHYAAMNGKTEIIDKLLSVCSDYVKDVTIFGETAIHLAVKCFKLEAVGSLLKWLEKSEMEEVVNWGDVEGNTVLHIAASRKQVETINLLLDWNNTSSYKLQVNVVNKKGLAPLDMVDMFIESSNDVHLRDILQRAGASASSEPHIVPNTPTENNPPSEKPKRWSDIIKHFEFQWQRDSPGEARKTLLLIATLIAAVTFEAGINPPDYIFQRSRDETSLASLTAFLVGNTAALSTALSIVDYLTVGLPFQRELRVSLITMLFAYGWSLGNTRPTGTVKNVLLSFAIFIPFFLRGMRYVLIKFGKSRRRNS